MRSLTHKQYRKAWIKLPIAKQQEALIALKLLYSDPTNPRLRLHQLKGKYFPQYSISAGGDLRIHFLRMDDDTVLLMHANLKRSF